MSRHQRGSSLLLVLISLTALLFSALALIRATDTSSAIAGNIAAKQAATAAADVGVAAAGERVDGLASADTAQAGWYYAVQLPTASTGLPTVDWSGVAPLAVGNYQMQYVVDRLCIVAPVTDATTQCAIAPVSSEGISHRAGAAWYRPQTAVHYRVTVRVRGPKQAESYVQALFTK